MSFDNRRRCSHYLHGRSLNLHIGNMGYLNQLQNLGSEDFLVDGFLDWSTAEGDHASELNWTTQWKWNVGKHKKSSDPNFNGIP
jgi:hypothetical protein